MDLKLFLRAYWDRLAAALLVVAGAVALVLGWVGVSGTALASQQLPYLVSGAVGGIALIGIGATAWLSADQRDEWRKLDDLEEAIRSAQSLATDPVSAPSSAGNGKGNGAGDDETNIASVTGPRSRRAPSRVDV